MPAADHSSVSHFVGGNALDQAPAGAVPDFIRKHEGHTVITKVLICNNGIAAVKEIRSIRKWAYETFGNERAIEFTVMATPEDLKINADYIRMADQYVEVPGGSNNNNYANVDLIVDIAERMHVHAVWAGWGHASENPRLPEALRASSQKIIFIGPPGSAMRSLGDKISSTIVAQHADVPCMPWSGTGVKETIMSEQGFLTVSDETYQRACIHTAEEGLEKAQKIGFPVMIKASEGGGGKGIRMCSDADTFKQLYNAVLGEVPGSPVFVMKLAGKARHLEVQLMADQYGNAISIFGRDCSVQRRHQKIIEEAPVTIAPEAARDSMEKAAVRLAKLVGYVSAGTVEWLYSPDSGEFSFLELNPRLQVEHPTTEMVSGVNIPAAQLQVAMGIPLYRIRDIRTLYGMDPRGAEPIDFEFNDPESFKTQRKPQPRGHVVACRITAEDASEGFRPSMGTVSEINFKGSGNCWGYFSIGGAGGLHEFADSQFGHIFAFGTDRSDARNQMILALKDLNIRGEFKNTNEFLLRLLETAEFTKNHFTTGWLDSLIKERFSAEKPPQAVAVVAAAAVKFYLASRECELAYSAILSKGQVPPKDTIKTFFSTEFVYAGEKYSWAGSRAGKNSYSLFLRGQRVLVDLQPLSDGGVLMKLGGKSHTVYWQQDAAALRVMINQKTALIENEEDPSQLKSPSPGKLVSILAPSGTHVKAGQPLCELEIMKMLMPITAAEDGLITWLRAPGITVAPGELLGILTLDDPSRVVQATPYTGRLPDFDLPVIVGAKPHQRFDFNLSILHDVLAGYDRHWQPALIELLENLSDNQLPYGQVNQILSTLSGRIPAKLEELLRSTIETAHARGSEFPAARLRKISDSFVRDSVDPAAAVQVARSLTPITVVLEALSGGPQGYASAILASLLEQYLDVETRFAGESDVVLTLRQEAEGDLEKVVAMQISHNGIAAKNSLLLAILQQYGKGFAYAKSGTAAADKVIDVLHRLAALQGKSTAPVALKAREVAMSRDQPSLEERMRQMQSILQGSVQSVVYGTDSQDYHEPQVPLLRELTDSQYTVYDVLHSFFGGPNVETPIAFAALVTYVLRAYRAYDVVKFAYAVEEFDVEQRAVLSWQFQLPDHADNPHERQASAGDLAAAAKSMTGSRQVLRTGVMTSCASLHDLRDVFPKILKYLPKEVSGEPVHVLNVAVTDEPDTKDEEARTAFASLANGFAAQLRSAGVRRVTFLHCQPGSYPWYTTLRPDQASGEWKEETTIRNIEPALAYQLELDRLTTNFEITSVPITSSTIHLYHARGIANPTDARFFVRSLVRPGRVQTGSLADYLVSASDRIVNDILNVLEVALGKPEYRTADASHIFMSFIYPLEITLTDIQQALSGFIERHGTRFFRLRITGAELRFVMKNANGSTTPIRAFITNETGFVVRYEAYEEVIDDDGSVLLKNVAGPAVPASLHMQSAHQPYTTKVALQARRSRAHALQTTFAYDLVDVLRQALRSQWRKHPVGKVPSDPLQSVVELVLDEKSGELHQVKRAPGSNNIGMVAWLIDLLTPEYPEGRQIVLIANDVTIQAGSFGPAEDHCFAAASQLAREVGIPRLYVSANSGARIGLATEALDLFRVKFVQNDPAKGFEYLYLDEAALASLGDKNALDSVITSPRTADDGTTHHVLTDIVGLQRGQGVECLSGSGLIAGETSRACQEIFTATIVTGRSVGIGAYLARLGERVIQVEGSPLILTGYSALNKLLGREVYTSNLQLGGPQIMYRNGVSHLVAADDLAAMHQAVRWLAFAPKTKSSALPRLLSPADPWDRAVTYSPPAAPYNPRWLLAGARLSEINGGTPVTNGHSSSATPQSPGEDWVSGVLDRDSWQETLGGWATSVVVGRGRLGGIPLGVVAFETRTLERVVPADPANPNSNEQRILEAGQVWYPNSAYKTAQAIKDFNREGLPLLMLANTRGFSGGLSDMHNEVLKQGSLIVDALVAYKRPVFVYLPPNAELRGGAFVVVATTINQQGKIEMYADPSARMGVLEPAGLVEIKMRAEAQRKLQARLDPAYANLAAKGDKEALAKRVEETKAVFHSVSVAYAGEQSSQR
ncbi:putative acetyl-CoA carboxylase [Ceraceosorus guamensis]|uniref:Putative acetyl-CoA carboxylase n=1 Tax=Ceraceosorus guamensis TaxID=1522189 RepID=A0A316VW18_9BASI|nr:putative acetyl-CoA carboxylase [Ceraceosorus guamensis]PWN41690.1 putative acetyl-CoA carboxylase [Ceraceosorus guamensis]